LVIVAALLLILGLLLFLFKKLQHKHLIVAISVITLLVSVQLLMDKI